MDFPISTKEAKPGLKCDHCGKDSDFTVQFGSPLGLEVCGVCITEASKLDFTWTCHKGVSYRVTKDKPIVFPVVARDKDNGRLSIMKKIGFRVVFKDDFFEMYVDERELGWRTTCRVTGKSYNREARATMDLSIKEALDQFEDSCLSIGNGLEDIFAAKSPETAKMVAAWKKSKEVKP